MEKGNRIELKVEKSVFEGEGLAFYENKAVFVPEGVPGDILEVEIVSSKKDYARGIIKKIIEPSDMRVKPQCECFEECGGCDYMMISYDNQLKFKKIIVEEIMGKIGKIKNCNIKDVIPMEDPYYYRNKIIQPFGIKDKKCISGFYKKKTHEIIDNDLCLIQSKISNNILKKIKEIINTGSISIYDETLHKGLLRNVMIRTNSVDEAMVVLILNGKPNIEVEKLIKSITESFNNVKSVYVSINTKKTNVVMGEKNIHIFGSENITESIEGIKFLINPMSFFQVNATQMKKLYKKAIEYIYESKSKVVVDAYSGTGTIAAILAKKTEKVYAIEIIKEAVDAGIKSMKNNKIENVFFIKGPVEEELIKLADSGEKIDSIVFDPPRKGLEKEIIEKVSEVGIDNIVYISCNPATFARDSALFYEKGYEIEEITPVDMFPHTHHIEIVAKIIRRK